MNEILEALGLGWVMAFADQGFEDMAALVNLILERLG